MLARHDSKDRNDSHLPVSVLSRGAPMARPTPSLEALIEFDYLVDIFANL